MPVPSKQDDNPIASELKRFEAQIKEIQDGLESIKVMEISDPEEKMKIIVAKINASLKLPVLLQSLDDLKSRAKLKADDIKGDKSLSPLEDGSLD